MEYCYQYPRPAVTVDMVIFRKNENREREILLIKRKNTPFKGSWAIPGGFVNMDETLLQSAKRELAEETGLKGISLYQFYTFGDPGRDPRGRTISVAFWGYCDENKIVKAGDDASETKWFSLKRLPKMAFDHDLIIKKALEVIL